MTIYFYLMEYPKIIENGGGEKLTFVGCTRTNGVEYLEIENTVQPHSGPPMHVHHLQDESITVVTGRIAGQVLGQQPVFYESGETAFFKRGVAHKFWNPDNTPMTGRGFITPVHNIEYFLTQIFLSTRKSGGLRPATFDAAYLLAKYKTEFDILDVPPLVKKIIFPVVLYTGRLRGLHKKFAGAPDAVMSE